MQRNAMANRWCRLVLGTPAELSLEPHIAALGLRYRFQHPLWLFDGRLRYFPDFALLDAMVVVEVDDPSHATPKKRRADAERTQKLEAAGWRVWRCTNREALVDPAGTVARLKLEMNL